MIHRARHLQDERLLDCYLAERSGEAIDPPAAEHLADCASCGTRYTNLTQLMDRVRTEGVAEADAVFTPERLRAQQQQIARRIERVGRPVRVIGFPAQFVRRTIGGSTTRTAPRWIAAAAAAGLVVGVALGASYEWEWHVRTGRPVARDAARGSGHLSPISTRGTGSSRVAADDAFLSELELALDRPHTRELVAYDALTPHVREVRDQR